VSLYNLDATPFQTSIKFTNLTGFGGLFTFIFFNVNFIATPPISDTVGPRPPYAFGGPFTAIAIYNDPADLFMHTHVGVVPGDMAPFVKEPQTFHFDLQQGFVFGYKEEVLGNIELFFNGVSQGFIGVSPTYMTSPTRGLAVMAQGGTYFTCTQL